VFNKKWMDTKLSSDETHARSQIGTHAKVALRGQTDEPPSRCAHREQPQR
jgi:hypothetical protein